MRIKKIFIALFLSILLVLSYTPNTHAASDFHWEMIERETTYIQGVKYVDTRGYLTLKGETKEQHYHVFSANTVTTDFTVVAVDNYQPFAWSMYTLPVMADVAKQRFPHLNFVAGMNADFYDINNTGRATQTHIVNFEVLHRGSSASVRNAMGVLDNGQLIFGKPSYEGQHLNILNEFGEIKQRIKINKTNALPANNTELAIFYPGYANAIPEGYTKVVVKASDIKSDAGGNNQYAKGVLLSRTTDAITVGERQFVLVGNALSDENLITENDTLLVQELLGNGFQDARFAVGVGAALVLNGEIPASVESANPSGRHPRTAVGQAADGTVIMLMVEGRDIPNGRNGVTLPELAEIMKSLGAQTAYNLDGGGSSTAIIKDADDTEYTTVNFLSDLRLRSISNGIMFATGDLEPVMQMINYPDTREKFDAPTGLYIDDEGVFHFSGNNEYAHYTLMINGKPMYITKESVPLLLPAGQYQIQVAVKGNAEYATSAYSETYTYNVHKDNVKAILDLMRNMASR
ncbi:MAG TPA: phosphodiester glycosidase family protein [Acholeplasma sp.]|nr:phosphodiester glycosidase family protein [Acholeplasma sp.]